MDGPAGPVPTPEVLWCDACGRGGIARHSDLSDVRLAYELHLEHEREGPGARVFG